MGPYEHGSDRGPGAQPPAEPQTDAYEEQLVHREAGGEAPAAAGSGKKGGKGRTLTGVAAAAVTTVLAVIVAGQVTDQQGGAAEVQAQGGKGTRAAPELGEASRHYERPAAPESYEQKMARAYPLAKDAQGKSTYRAVGGDAKAPGPGRVLRYRVDVEEGLELDGQLFAEAVHKTLNDGRSWAHGGHRSFQRVGSGAADFVITLASPRTAAKECAKSGLDITQDNVSCDSAATERVVINAYRWAQGSDTYGQDKLYAYREMLINHEVGHRLGHNHESCSTNGAPAPVMMQQTKFLNTGDKVCRPNSWPYPTER